MKRILGFMALTALLFSTSPAKATPYASGVTNDNGTIRFILNEDADNVTVTFNNGSSTNDLGALPRGSQSFALGGATNFQILVSKSSANGFVRPTGATITSAAITNAAGIAVPHPHGTVLRTSADDNPLVNFFAPRGVTVNRNPKSPYFGRVYVANSLPGTTTSNGVSRAVGDGIYVLNADQSDAVGQGDTELTGGLNMVTTSASMPWKITVGQDDNLYICDWTDTTGTLFVTDPDVSGSSGQNVLGGPQGSLFPVTSSRIHGSVHAAVVSGSLAAGNLQAWILDEDLQANPDSATANQRNSLWRHDIGGSLPGPEVFPTRLFTPSGQNGVNTAAPVWDMDRGASGHFYMVCNRQTHDTSGLIVRDNRTTLGGAIWNSRNTSTNMTGGLNDILFDTYSVAVSHDQKYVAVMRRDARTWIIPLTNNVPDLSRRLWLATFPSQSNAGRALHFDAAGNLYAVNNISELMRVFSPGGTTLAVTGGDLSGTNGTFKLVTAPVFRTEATNQTLDAGNTLVMIGYVQGMGNVSYQWQLNGTNISGATAAIYTKANVQQTNAGNYTLIASNELGVATSSNAVLTVNDIAPVITVQPLPRSVSAGSNVVFTVTAVGSDPKAYQWFFEGSPIANATSSSYTRSNAQATNQGNYSVTVSNFVGGPITSDDAFLTVIDTGATIITHPTSRTVGAGANTTFSVTTVGTDPRSYQWQYLGENIPNATNSSYTRTNVQPVIDEGAYTVTVSNQFDIAFSSEAILTVTNRAPVISTQPKSATNNVDTPVTFSVVAVGTDPIGYQWLFGGSPITDATNSSYTINSVQSTNAGNYSVVLTNSIGTNTSSTVTLTVIVPQVPVPVIEPLVGVGTTNIIVTWSSVAGNTYRVQYNPDLNTTNWTTIADVVAEGNSAAVTNNPGIADQRYYRVILLQP